MHHFDPHILVTCVNVDRRCAIVSGLVDDRYTIVEAEDSSTALEMLQARPEGFDVVLLDDLELLRDIRSYPSLRGLTVVVASNAITSDMPFQGLALGSLYRVSETCDRDELRAVVCAAMEDRRNYLEIRDRLRQNTRTFDLMHASTFRLRTLDEGRVLASVLASACPDPDRAVFGLCELIINAVEHGNLEIGYQEKSRLLEEGDWLAEVERRLGLSEYAERFVEVGFERTDSGVQILITDQGKGFDWAPYLDIAPDRAFDSHGRGIAISRASSVDDLEYLGKGNVVRAIFHTDMERAAA